MKKIISILAMIGMSLALQAGVNDTVFSFSTCGQDVYADGTTVVDGECYALIWAATGAEFKGFLADGSLADEVSNKLVLVAPVARHGRCPKTVVALDEEYVKKLGNGSFAVVLLDTRVRGVNGSVKLAGLDDNGRPASVAAATVVSSDVKLDTGFVEAAKAEAAGAVASAVPADAPVPEIIGFNVEDGLVAIDFTGVEEFCTYNVKGGVNPDKINETIFNYDFNGEPDKDGTMRIVFAVEAAADCRFFRIVRR